MGACNGYAYHRIDRPVLVPDYEGREADEAMLQAILAVPEEPENRHPHGVY